MSAAASYGGLAQAAVMTALLFAVPVAFACKPGLRRVRLALQQVAPTMRATLLLLFAALPAIAAIAGVVAAFSPSVLTWLGLAADHCHEHPGHLHLCLLHPPQLAHRMLPSWLTVLALAGGAAAAATALYQWVRARRLVAGLLVVSKLDPARGVHVVPSEAPLAFVAGLRNPHVFMSSRLMRQLSPGQIDAVIAHERAHAARHDALCHALASALSVLHLPSVRRQLLAELALAAEQSCDEAACVATGDRLLVAEAILAVEKMYAAQGLRDTPRFATSHFNDSNVPERVQAMLAAPLAPRPVMHIAALTIAALFCVLTAAGGPLHHGVESVLGFLFH